MAQRVDVAVLTDVHETYLQALVLTPKRTTQSKDVPPPKKLRCYHVEEKYLHLPFKYADKVQAHVALPLATPTTGTGAGCWCFVGTLREHQVAITTEALSQLQVHRSTTLWLYPGCGKTAMGAYLGSHLPRTKPLLVSICRTALVESWCETFRQFTNARVYVVPTGAADLAAIRAADVLICMTTRQAKLPPDIRRGIGTYIVDEAHMFCETQARITGVLEIVCEHLILETATYTRLSRMHRFLDLVSGLHYVKRVYPFPFRVHKINIRMDINLSVPANANLIDAYRNLLISRPEYNEVVLDRIRAHRGRKVLVMTWLVAHVELLSTMCTQRNIPHATFYGSKDSYNDSDVIIATLGKTGVGFDEVFKVIGYNGSRISAVILPLTIKDPNFFYQCLGRAMRADTPVFDVIVHQHNITRKHWSYNHEAIRELPGFQLAESTVDLTARR